MERLCYVAMMAAGLNENNSREINSSCFDFSTFSKKGLFLAQTSKVHKVFPPYPSWCQEELGKDLPPVDAPPPLGLRGERSRWSWKREKRLWRNGPNKYLEPNWGGAAISFSFLYRFLLRLVNRDEGKSLPTIRYARGES